MGSILTRGSKLYAKVKSITGKWERHATGINDTTEGRKEVEKWITKTERQIEAERAEGAGPMTVNRWAEKWRDKRNEAGKDGDHEYARLEEHVLRRIGQKLLVDAAGTPATVELFHTILTTPTRTTGEPPSGRTMHNIHGVYALMMRDAKLAGEIEHAPERLGVEQLGAKVDKDPEWRALAMLTREEVQTLISSLKIPWDRRVFYAIELLAGTRPGEAAALRWRNYDPAKQPLGELLVARSYNAKRRRIKNTKTDAVRHVPVHPTLAEILGEWWIRGWAVMMGREPTPDDLIVPMPPADAAARTSARKHDEPLRADYYSRSCWVDIDLPALNWRHRRHYDVRATFVTLALDDGADPYIIETRVTHTKRSSSTMERFYNRGVQWEITCRELAKLKIVRVQDDLIAPTAADGTSRNHNGETKMLGPSMVQSDVSRRGSWLRRRVSNPRPGG